MASAKERLKALCDKFDEEEPAVSGFSTVPAGKYICTIEKPTLVVESTAPFALGEMELRVGTKICDGKHKDRGLTFNIYLEQPSKEINGRTMPSGMSAFKGLLTDLEIEWEGDMEKACRKLVGNYVKIGVVDSGRAYYNGAADPTAVTKVELGAKPTVKIEKSRKDVSEIIDDLVG